MSILYDVDTEKHTIAAATSINSLDAMTIVLWYKATSLSVASHVAVSKKAGATPGFTFLRPKLGSAPDDWKFRHVRATTDSLIETTGNIVQIGRWEFIAVADDASAVADVVHGTLTTRPTVPTLSTSTKGIGVATDDSANDLIVGSSTLASQSASAHIGFVGLWNRRMSVAQMQAQWQRPHCNDGCVLFAYPGLHGGTKLIDLSGNKNNGAMSGAPTWSAPPPWPSGLIFPIIRYLTFPVTASANRRVSLGDVFVGNGRTVLVG